MSVNPVDLILWVVVVVVLCVWLHSTLVDLVTLMQRRNAEIDAALDRARMDAVHESRASRRFDAHTAPLRDGGTNTKDNA